MLCMVVVAMVIHGAVDLRMTNGTGKRSTTTDCSQQPITTNFFDAVFYYQFLTGWFIFDWFDRCVDFGCVISGGNSFYNSAEKQ